MKKFAIFLLFSVVPFSARCSELGAVASEQPKAKLNVTHLVQLYVWHKQGLPIPALLKVLCKKDPDALLECMNWKNELPEMSDQEKHDILLTASEVDSQPSLAILWKHNFRFIEKEKRNVLKSLILADKRVALAFLIGADLSVDANQIFRDAIELQCNNLALWLWKSKNLQIDRQDHCRPHNTPLHIAAMHNPEFLEIILKDVASIGTEHPAHNALLLKPNVWGSCSLHCAAALGQLASVRRLLGLKVPVDVLDFFRNTPLIRAARGGHHEVALELISAGAAIEHTNGHGYTALTAPKDSHVEKWNYERAITVIQEKYDVQCGVSKKFDNTNILKVIDGILEREEKKERESKKLESDESLTK